MSDSDYRQHMAEYFRGQYEPTTNYSLEGYKPVDSVVVEAPLGHGVAFDLGAEGNRKPDGIHCNRCNEERKLDDGMCGECVAESHEANTSQPQIIHLKVISLLIQ